MMNNNIFIRTKIKFPSVVCSHFCHDKRENNSMVIITIENNSDYIL